MRRWFQTLLLALPLLTGGCATSALWNKTQLDAWNEPADHAKLQLFDARSQKDFLIVYDEYSERNDTTRPRAYFLNQNEAQVVQGHKPHFVSPKLSRALPPVPVLSSLPPPDTNFTSVIYAVSATNRPAFAIFSNASKTNHDLPVYNDGRGQIYRVALTPVAVLADLTIVGGVIGYLWLQSGGPGYSH